MFNFQKGILAKEINKIAGTNFTEMTYDDLIKYHFDVCYKLPISFYDKDNFREQFLNSEEFKNDNSLDCIKFLSIHGAYFGYFTFYSIGEKVNFSDEFYNVCSSRLTSETWQKIIENHHVNLENILNTSLDTNSKLYLVDSYFMYNFKKITNIETAKYLIDNIPIEGLRNIIYRYKIFDANLITSKFLNYFGKNLDAEYWRIIITTYKNMFLNKDLLRDLNYNTFKCKNLIMLLLTLGCLTSQDFAEDGVIDLVNLNTDIIKILLDFYKNKEANKKFPAIRKYNDNYNNYPIILDKFKKGDLEKNYTPFNINRNIFRLASKDRNTKSLLKDYNLI
jgi:hypothetical protein